MILQPPVHGALLVDSARLANIGINLVAGVGHTHTRQSEFGADCGLCLAMRRFVW